MNQRKPKPDIPFTPVPVRYRRDGWTADKQIDFIEALAACGCVDEACKRVGMGRSSVYDLRARIDAASFRAAWEAALDHAVTRLSDAAFSRSIHGVTRPVFYKGEQIGEKVYYDERLTMFLLRYRDPFRYGKWRDKMQIDIPPDGIARLLWQWIDRLEQEAEADEEGRPRPRFRPIPGHQVVSPADLEAARRGRNPA
jgi:hypothetical protein